MTTDDAAQILRAYGGEPQGHRETGPILDDAGTFSWEGEARALQERDRRRAEAHAAKLRHSADPGRPWTPVMDPRVRS